MWADCGDGPPDAVCGFFGERRGEGNAGSCRGRRNECRRNDLPHNHAARDRKGDDGARNERILNGRSIGGHIPNDGVRHVMELPSRPL